jgi:hypothetical protein
VLGIVGAMYMRNGILLLLPIALVCGAAWALYSLYNMHGFWSFIVLCAVNFAFIVTVWYTVDHWQDLSQ